MKVDLKNISKRFGATQAVDDVTVEIADGEVFFLLGPSGCGKTTLLRTIAGFCAPDAGDVLFDGRAVTGLPPHKRNTGMVFQNYALWPHMSVAANVAFGLNVPGRRVPAAERAERVNKMLKTVQIETLAERKPNELSGGQQQRVALARALVVAPDCLLLDEPLSNLDAKLRLTMRTEIRRIVKEIGVTTVYVTHDQKEALSMADRCAVMNAGRIEQIGTPTELYNLPRNRFVADFVGEANLLPGTVLSADQTTVSVESSMGKWTCAAREPAPEPGAKVLLCVRPEAIAIEATAQDTPNSFPATVAQSTYLGETAQYVLNTADGAEITAFELNPKQLPETGTEQVSFHVSPEDVVLLPDPQN